MPPRTPVYRRDVTIAFGNEQFNGEFECNKVTVGNENLRRKNEDTMFKVDGFPTSSTFDISFKDDNKFEITDLRKGDKVLGYDKGDGNIEYFAGGETKEFDSEVSLVMRNNSGNKELKAFVTVDNKGRVDVPKTASQKRASQSQSQSQSQPQTQTQQQEEEEPQQEQEQKPQPKSQTKTQAKAKTANKEQEKATVEQPAATTQAKKAQTSEKGSKNKTVTKNNKKPVNNDNDSVGSDLAASLILDNVPASVQKEISSNHKTTTSKSKKSKKSTSVNSNTAAKKKEEAPVVEKKVEQPEQKKTTSVKQIAKKPTEEPAPASAPAPTSVPTATKNTKTNKSKTPATVETNEAPTTASITKVEDKKIELEHPVEPLKKSPRISTRVKSPAAPQPEDFILGEDEPLINEEQPPAPKRKPHNESAVKKQSAAAHEFVNLTVAVPKDRLGEFYQFLANVISK